MVLHWIAVPPIFVALKEDSSGYLRKFVENSQKIVVSGLKTFFLFWRQPKNSKEIGVRQENRSKFHFFHLTRGKGDKKGKKSLVYRNQ